MNTIKDLVDAGVTRIVMTRTRTSPRDQLLAYKGPWLFWSCPKGCDGMVEWSKLGDRHQATCKKCGTKSRMITPRNQTMKPNTAPTPDRAGYWWVRPVGQKHWEMVEALDLSDKQYGKQIYLYSCSKYPRGGCPISMAEMMPGEWVFVPQPT